MKKIIAAILCCGMLMSTVAASTSADCVIEENRMRSMCDKVYNGGKIYNRDFDQWYTYIPHDKIPEFIDRATKLTEMIEEEEKLKENPNYGASSIKTLATGAGIGLALFLFTGITIYAPLCKLKKSIEDHIKTNKLLKSNENQIQMLSPEEIEKINKELKLTNKNIIKSGIMLVAGIATVIIGTMVSTNIEVERGYDLIGRTISFKDIKPFIENLQECYNSGKCDNGISVSMWGANSKLSDKCRNGEVK